MGTTQRGCSIRVIVAACRGVDGRPAPDRDERHVDRPDRPLLLGPQRRLPEIAHMAHPHAAEGEHEHGVRPA
jgi:hypothetical protein